jgi:hypothetical protein
VRRCPAALALVLACAPVGPLAPVDPTVTHAPDEAPTVDAVQATQPSSCPEPHGGPRLRIGPGLRTARVAAWDGVPGLRPAGPHIDLPGVVTGLLWSVAYAEGADVRRRR